MFSLFKKKKIEEEKGPSAAEGSRPKADLDKEITIHVMPEHFREAHMSAHKAKRTGVLILAAGTLFLLALAAGAFFYFFKTSAPETPAPSQANINTETQPETQPVNKTASDLEAAKTAYLNMKGEFDNASSLAALEAVVQKYGTQTFITAFSNLESQLEASASSSPAVPALPSEAPAEATSTATSTPASTATSTEALPAAISLEDQTVASLKKQAPGPDQITNIQGEMSGNDVILHAFAADATGTVKMVLDKTAAWKVDQESWLFAAAPATTTPAAQPAAIQAVPGVDSDGDGLTDAEEKALGTDPNKKDTDGDSYSDLTEVQNLYDPTVYANGRLANNKNIKKYTNSTFGYSCLYPAGWSLTTVGGDDSVIIKTDSDQFFQIIAQPNADKQSIEDWYKKQFNVTSVDPARMVSGQGWRGIRNDTGLVIYLADSKNDYIFTLSYSMADTNVLEYKNLFDLLVHSFTLNQ